MVGLRLTDVAIEFALYQAPARSFKQLLIHSATAGRIGSTADRNLVVVRALADINLDLREGDRIALIGHNGAGKTTLLRVMAGIFQPTRGKVECKGQRITLFDIHSGFDDEATGYENILLRGLLMGLSREEIASRTQEIAEFSGLGDFMHLPVRTYSSGMLLRLLFSIATSGATDIVLMDEWIATGDQDFIEKANKRLRELVDKSRVLAFASHNNELLRDICNRAILLDGGSVAMAGTVDEVIGYYTKRKVA